MESEKECHIDQVAAMLETQSTDQQGASGIVHIATGQYRSTFFRVGLQSRNGTSHSFIDLFIHLFIQFLFSSGHYFK